MDFLVSDCSVGKYKRQVGKMGSQVGKNEYQVGIDAAWSKCPPWNSDEELQQEGRVSLTEKAFG